MVKHANQVRAHEKSESWLGQMKAAHATLLGAIDELAQLTGGPLPAKSVLDNIRWKVSKASLSRRMLWGRIHAHLSTLGDAQPELRNLQDADIRLIRASSEHVGRWTADAILRDWQGYCDASERMRAKMTDAIANEQRRLYPMLETLEG